MYISIIIRNMSTNELELNILEYSLSIESATFTYVCVCACV